VREEVLCRLLCRSALPVSHNFMYDTQPPPSPVPFQTKAMRHCVPGTSSLSFMPAFGMLPASVTRMSIWRKEHKM
jgi:hypothetical protein